MGSQGNPTERGISLRGSRNAVRIPSPQARSAGGDGGGSRGHLPQGLNLLTEAGKREGDREKDGSASKTPRCTHRSLASDWTGNSGEDGENCPSLDLDEPKTPVRIDHLEGIHQPPPVNMEVTIAWATDPMGQRHLAWWSDWARGSEAVQQVEVALVWRILALYVEAQRQGAERLTVGLRSARLPKMLLQAGRAVRAVTMARALTALHEAVAAGSCQLVLEGPHAIPERLQRTLWAIRRPTRDARGAA